MAMEPQASTLDPSSGVAEVNRLLSELEHNLQEAKLSLQQQQKLLGEVKVFGRNPKTAGPIFTEKGISTLSSYGLDTESNEVSREALRCLANSFLLNESSRQRFVDLRYAPKAAERLKTLNRDDEFLISRMLFLLTYNTSCDFAALVKDHSLADSMVQNLREHSRAFSDSGRSKSRTSPMEDMAMIETLKLMFNLTYYHPNLTSEWTPAIEPLINLLLHYPIPTKPLQPPITYMLNALMNLDLDATDGGSASEKEASKSPLFPSADPESVLRRLTSILLQAIREHPVRELDEAAASLCTILRRAYELASPDMKLWMQHTLLPNDADRSRPLGQGDTLSARLLQLSISPNLPTLRENIASLLFELSDKDANKFIENIGYGYASGFLTSHNITIPASAMKSDQSATKSGADVNPVTGQLRSAEEQERPQTDDMTEEEKEREAERLYVLFERLRATGVVNVKNPVQQAIDEGRFEELD